MKSLKCNSKVLVISDNSFIRDKITAIFTNKKYKSYSLVESKDYDLNNENLINQIIMEYDLIISAHCKKIFPLKLVKSTRCINIHPGYNPYNRGWYPHIFSIINKFPTGATIHEMDEKLDHGEIIFQEMVSIENHDDSLSIYKRILRKEMELFNKYFYEIISGNYRKYKTKNKGNINFKKDFQKLCLLNLDHIATLRQHIDLLRALSHGKYKNAYYLDENGNKIGMKIKIEKLLD